MLVSKDAKSEVIGVGNIDKVVMAEKTVGSDRPTGFRVFELGSVERVCGKGEQYVCVELFLVHDDSSTKNRFK